MYWASKGQLNTCIFGEYPSVFPEKNCNKEQHYKTAAVLFFSHIKQILPIMMCHMYILTHN